MEEDLVSEANLLRLIRLPWFRTGVIPEELRWRLIQQTSPAEQKAVRKAIVDLLESNPAPEESFASADRKLEIAFNRSWLNRRDRKLRRQLSEALQSSPASDPVQDYTTLQSLDSMKLSPLDFVLPRQLRHLVFARGVSAFGLRSATPAFAALCASLLVLISMKTINMGGAAPTVAVKPAGTDRPPLNAVGAYHNVMLRSSPEGAAITVNGKPCVSPCELQLPPGNYLADATLTGYQNATKEFAVTGDKGGPSEVRLILEAPPPQISLSTDLADGTLSVDHGPAAQIQGVETEVKSLAPGPHTLEIQSTGAKATLALNFTSGALPKLTEKIQAQGINAVVVSRYGSQAMVYSNTEGAPATIDGMPAGTVGEAGLEFRDLAPGPHEIQLTINGSTHKIPFESSLTSGIVASLLTERNVGSMRIHTGDDNVAVYFNGQKYKRATTRGRLLVYLAPKQYVVRVEKPGLWAADQTVDVRRGEEAQLTFKLVPAKATLEVRNAPAGTEVWLDGAQIGSAPAGAFSSANIEPGKHMVALKKDGFKPIQGEHVFEPGKSITVEGALQSAVGSLKIEVSPAGIEGLQVRLRREGETQERAVSETELRTGLSLPEGTYRVTGSAPQYQEAVVSVPVVVGRDATATLALKRLMTPTAVSARLPANWRVQHGGGVKADSSWTREGNVWVKRGGDFVMWRPSTRRLASTTSRRS